MHSKSPWRHCLGTLHGSYHDVRCRCCVVMWHEGEGSPSDVRKDLINCHMISGPCPCEKPQSSFFFPRKSCRIWKILRYHVDSLVSVGTSVVEQPGRWMDSRSHKADYKLFAFWTPLDLKVFLLGGTSENCIQHRHKEKVLKKHRKGEQYSSGVYFEMPLYARLNTSF